MKRIAMTAAPRPEASTIMIVDDESSIRTFVTRVLNGAGYRTTSASCGPEALTLMQEAGPVNLLISDLLMPEMRGDELVRRAREADPDLKVLYVTAYRDQLFQNPATLGSNAAFLDKPFRMEELLEAVSMLMPPDARQARTIETGSPAPRTGRLLRVLIVEDSVADALLIQRELERSRFEVVCERVDTRTGLATALEGRTWDLIITDHTMPQLNAMAVLRMVRDRGLTVPCVLVSGTATEQTAAAALKIGADDFVSKHDLKALGPSAARALDDASTRHARSARSRVRLPDGHEFDVLEWAADSATLTGLVGLKPGQDHDGLLLSGEFAKRVRFHVDRCEVATLTAGAVVYQTVASVREG